MSKSNLYQCSKCDFSSDSPLFRCPNCGAYESLRPYGEASRGESGSLLRSAGNAPAFLSCPYCRTSYRRDDPKCPSCGAASPLTERVQIGKPGNPPRPLPKSEPIPTVKQIAKASGCATALKIVFIGFAALTIIFLLAICVLAFINTAAPTSLAEPGRALFLPMEAAARIMT